MFDEHLTNKEKWILRVLLVFVVLLMIWMEVDYQRSVNDCVDAGQNYEVCANGLR